MYGEYADINDSHGLGRLTMEFKSTTATVAYSIPEILNMNSIGSRALTIDPISLNRSKLR